MYPARYYNQGLRGLGDAPVNAGAQFYLNGNIAATSSASIGTVLPNLISGALNNSGYFYNVTAVLQSGVFLGYYSVAGNIADYFDSTESVKSQIFQSLLDAGMAVQSIGYWSVVDPYGVKITEQSPGGSSNTGNQITDWLNKTFGSGGGGPTLLIVALLGALILGRK